MRARSSKKLGTANGRFAVPGGMGGESGAMGGEDARKMRQRRSERMDHL